MARKSKAPANSARVSVTKPNRDRGRVDPIQLGGAKKGKDGQKINRDVLSLDNNLSIDSDRRTLGDIVCTAPPARYTVDFQHVAKLAKLTRLEYRLYCMYFMSEIPVSRLHERIPGMNREQARRVYVEVMGKLRQLGATKGNVVDVRPFGSSVSGLSCVERMENGAPIWSLGTPDNH